MTLSRKGRAAVAGAVALMLLGTLVFLVVRTAGLGALRDSEGVELLRELRALDIRLDSDAARLTHDYSAAQSPAADRGALITRVLRELEREGSPAVAALATPLRAGMNDKLAALAAFRAEHAKSVATHQAADEAATAVGREGATARQKSPHLTGASYAVGARAEALRYRLREVGVETIAEDARALDAELLTLRAAGSQADPALGAATARAEQAARAFLEAVAREAQAYRRVAFHPVGQQVELGARNLAKTLQAQLEDQQRWRIYLAYYAAALLIVVGYLAIRVAATQAQLRAANEGLERRVAERTAELSTALTKLKESEAQLVQSEKMSSLGQMVAGVAHEINTPLAYVKNSLWTVRSRIPELRAALTSAERLLELLRDPSPDPTDLEEAFAALSTSLGRLREHQVVSDLDALTKDGVHGIEQMSELVGNLKNFSRVDRSRVSSFNVNEGVNATLLIARAQLRNVDIEKKLADVPHITCSPSQVNQVLLNLLTNAAQAMDKSDARITVATRRGDAGTVAIEVEDNGRGIAPEVLPRIFDPFFTTKEVGKGTGLGLSIAYKIVEQHGGRIDVRSTVGVGSVFTVTLPVDPPAQQSESANDEVAA